MTILINNTPAVLRADIAFDYVAKNSLFDNKDGYTLEITFPLKDCLTNMQIFGVTEAIPDSISTPYDCRIIEGDFDKRGILRVLSVTAHELQAQFIEYGPSAQPIQTGLLNLLDGVTTDSIHDWDDLTLPELMADVTLTPGDYTYGTDYEQVTFYDEREEKIWDFDEQGHADDGKLFCQWYFHRIVRAVIEQLGYTADFSHLADHYLFWHLLSLNAHFTDQPFATSLPDWTVSKFFEQIEHLFAVRVVVDNNAKTIAFVPLSEFYNPNATIEVEPSTDHEVETLDEEQTIDWQRTPHLTGLQKTDDCQWYIDAMERDGGVLHLESLDYLNQCLTQTLTLSDLDEAQTWKEQIDARYLIEAGGCYFLLREGQGTQRGMWDIVPLNLFAANDAAVDVDFAPVMWHTYYDATHSESRTVPIVQTPEPPEYFNREGFVYQAEGLPYSYLEKGEQKQSDLLYSNFRVALSARKEGAFFDPAEIPLLWTSNIYTQQLFLHSSMPYYYDFIGSAILSHFKDGQIGLQNEEIAFTRSIKTIGQALDDRLLLHPTPAPSLSILNTKLLSAFNSQFSTLPAIYPARLYRFDFLYKGVPDPKAVYRIHGKRYLCRQLTVQMTADGISDLKQGEFFRIETIRDADMADAM